MRANCEPPENMNRLSTQVCQMSSPDATAKAPNESPYAETASPTARLARTAADRVARIRRLAAPPLAVATVCSGFAQGLEQRLGVDILVEHRVGAGERGRGHVVVEVDGSDQHDLGNPAEFAHAARRRGCARRRRSR